MTQEVVGALTNGQYELTDRLHNNKPVYSDPCGDLFIYYDITTVPHTWILGAVIGLDAGFAYKEVENLNDVAPWWIFDDIKEQWVKDSTNLFSCLGETKINV